jgi:hypothetical protein
MANCEGQVGDAAKLVPRCPLARLRAQNSADKSAGPRLAGGGLGTYLSGALGTAGAAFEALSQCI